MEPGEEDRLRALTKDDWLWRLRFVAPLETGCRIGEILALHTTIQRIDTQRRASGEAAKWEAELAELQKNLQRGHKKTTRC